MNDRICTIAITIDGTIYRYEAHSYDKCAEILANQFETLKNFNRAYDKNYKIENFEVLFFQEV